MEQFMPIPHTLLAIAIGISIIALEATILTAIQSAIIKRGLWAVAIIIAIIEIMFFKLCGVVVAIYTAYRWDKARKAKQEENTTPPEV